MENHDNSPHKRQGKDTKKEYAKKLFKVFQKEPISRRMAATKIGFPDQTYMVTQFVFDWIKQGKAQIVGAIKCGRSGRIVESITTNPELFKPTNDNQLTLF